MEVQDYVKEFLDVQQIDDIYLLRFDMDTCDIQTAHDIYTHLAPQFDNKLIALPSNIDLEKVKRTDLEDMLYAIRRALNNMN